jgi:hypothetical protein
MIEPLSRRTSVNPFRREGTSGRLIKRVSRAISGQHEVKEGQGGGGLHSTSSTATPSGSLPPPRVLPPLSPALPLPPLSPCPSYSSSDSANSSRSIRRKPVPEVDLSYFSSSSSSSFSFSSSTDHDGSTEEDITSSEEQVRIVEVIDGLWTSTCDRRVDVSPPAWLDPSPKLSPLTFSSRLNRPARLPTSNFTKSSKSKARPSFSPSSSPKLEVDFPWLPPLLPDESQHRGLDLRHRRPEVDAVSPALSNRSSFSTSTRSSSSLSPHHAVASPRSGTPLPRGSVPDRKSLLRIESGGRQLVFDSSTTSAKQGVITSEDIVDDEDEEEILVIRMPSKVV